MIADLVEDAGTWLDVFTRRDLPYDLVQPFLEKFGDDKRDGWEETASRLLDEDRHAVFVAGLLQRRELPVALMNKILDKAGSSPYLIETLCQKGRVPQPMLVALLNNPDQDAALAAAVGGDLEIYQRALAVENLGGRRLEPLAKLPDAQWADLAVAAVEAGFEERLVASTSLHGIRSWSGSGLPTFQRWDQAFAALENDPREEVREIARQGRRGAHRRIQRAEAEERQEALQGI